MSNDLTKRRVGPGGANPTAAHADTALGFQRVRDDIAALDATQIAFTPSDTSAWADPPPTTLAEATQRLAVAGNTGTWPA